ncbi:hypothetical protein EDD11_006842 [Mortierella claussenii]|nr:hypothetical protein EDD11_006842 [Mortierella claussenii]
MTLEGTVAYPQYMSSSEHQSAEGRKSMRTRISELYDQCWYLRKTWDMREAQKCAIDLGMKVLLRMTGVNGTDKVSATGSESEEGSQPEAHSAPAVFTVGLGSFNARTDTVNSRPSDILWLVAMSFIPAPSVPNLGAINFWKVPKLPGILGQGRRRLAQHRQHLSTSHGALTAPQCVQAYTHT